MAELKTEERLKSLSVATIAEINVAFENTVLCARGNSPKDSYEYAERMAQYVIKIINEELNKPVIGTD